MNKLKIIAEIAQGFEGDEKIANLLLDGAIKAGVDIVKFQLVFADEICVKKYKYYSFFKKLEMKISIWEKLVKKAKKKNIKFYFDVFGIKSLKLAKKLNVDGIKITTTDFYNKSLIALALKNFKNVLFSVAGNNVDQLKNYLKDLKDNENLILMYGFQSEPTNIADNNLLRLKILKENFPKHRIGFMDHTQGNTKFAKYIPFTALSTGITFLEKHITLDYELQLEDYVSALSIDRFQTFLQELRVVETALGKNEIKISKKEKDYKNLAAKNVILNKNLSKNSKISHKDISLIRVLNDKNNFYIKDPKLILNKKLKVNLKKNTPIKLEDLF